MRDRLPKFLARILPARNSFARQILQITGNPPLREQLYHLALRHSSATRQQKGNRLNNQRLEFLGDAVLSAVTAEFLYLRYPQAEEGFLTSMRSKIVSRKHLNQLAQEMGLNKLLVMRHAKGTAARSIYGDALEALIGAVYLDHGYASCRKFILQRIVDQWIDLEDIEGRLASHKGALLEWSQKHRHELLFETAGCYGENHARQYEISLLLNGQPLSSGWGSSKKKAEEDAARKAWKKLMDEEEEL